jgi:PKD repeat protein
MTVYTFPTGAIVFAAGTIQWSWGLDDFNAPVLRPSRAHPAVQQMTRNILARLDGDRFPAARAGGPYHGSAETSVHFDGAGSSDADGTITRYAWDFGDGVTGTGRAPAHVYRSVGTYQVRLTVIDDRGAASSATTTVSIGSALTKVRE